MKPSFRLLAFALGAGLAFTAPSAAQAQVSVGVQLGAPAWGPPVPQGTQYYYIPEIDGYYDIYNQVYVVFDGQQWVALPYIDGYDPYYFHPVPVSYVGAQPWLYIGNYRRYYPQYVAGWHRGGLGGGGRYYGQDYGAGRVYGYGGRPGGYNGGGYAGRPGGYPGGGIGRPGNFDNRGNGGFGRPGYGNPGQPQGGVGGGPGQPQGGYPGRDNRGGFQGGSPGGGQPGGQPGGNFGGGNRGGQPGGGNPGGGGGQPGGGRRGGR